MRLFHCPRAWRIGAKICLFSILVTPAAGQSAPGGAEDHYTLQRAIDTALRGNRVIRNADLDVARAIDVRAATHSQLFPQFSIYALASQILAPVNFRFPKGAFGSFPQIGPFPPVDTNVTAPAKFTTLTFATITQPVTQLRRIRLGIRARDAQAAIAREGARGQRNDIAAAVRQTYYALLQAQSDLIAKDEELIAAHELERLTADYVEQRVALDADLLDVRTRLNKLTYDRLATADQIDDARERLNDLMGRNVSAPLQAEPLDLASGNLPPVSTMEGRALSNRPDLKQARLRVTAADFDRQIKRDEFNPDVSLQVSYLQPYNIDVLPDSIFAAGVLLTWDPFDWGRRRHELSEKGRIVEQAKNGAEELNAQIQLQVRTAYRKSTEARARVQVTQNAQASARERLRVTLSRYREDAKLLKDVLDAQATLADADRDARQAGLAEAQARAELARVTGDE